MPNRQSNDSPGPIDGLGGDADQQIPAFDIGFEPYYRTQLEPPLYSARDYLANMRGRLSEGLTASLARSAVFAGDMGVKVAQQLAAPVESAGRFLNDAQARIGANLSQPVFDAAGFGERFGAFPELEPGQIPPATVLERRAALRIPGLSIPAAPDGSPLVVDPGTFDRTWNEYLTQVLPLRSSNFPAYGTRLEELEARFPPGSSWWSEFQRRRDEQEARTTVGFSAAEQPGANPPVPPAGTFLSVGAGKPPPVSAPPAGGTVFPTKPTIPGLIPPPVSAPPTRPIPPGMGGPPNPPMPVADVPVYDPSDSNGPCYVLVRPADIQGGMASCFPGSVPVNLLPGKDPRYPDGGIYCGQIFPCPPSATPAPPAFQPVPGPVPGSPCPEPVPAPCVSICGFEDLLEALKPGERDCPKWKAWKDAESGECYVQPADREPRNSVDELILESADAAALVAAINESCQPKPPKPVERPTPPVAPPGVPVQGCDWILPVEIDGALQVPNLIGFLTGVNHLDGTPRDIGTDTWKGWFWGPLARVYQSFWRLTGGKFTDLFNAAIRSQPCVSGANLALITSRALVNFVGLFVGDSLSQVKVPLTQHSNFLCPVAMPDVAAATQAWLRNAISQDTRDCWVRACGMRDELWGIVADSQRSRLNPDQLTRLLFRKEITPEEYAARIRELGFIRESDPFEIRKLGEQLPGPQDVVRFMMRDVSDERIVERFGLDDDFQAKFAGLTKQYAESAGIPADVMSLFWRAHWSIPSPTQLYEMFHRLGNLPDDDPNRVTLDDVKTALQQQDILPFWVDKLLAVSFRPLRLVDAKRAYFDGSIDQDEVLRVYRDVGYSDRDARILVEHQQRQKLLAGLRLPGAKAFITGTAPWAEWETELVESGYSPDQIATLKNRAYGVMERNRRSACAKAIKRRILKGEWETPQAEQELMSLGLDQDQSLRLASAWSCERSSRGKELQGGQLCKLYAEGMIDGPTMVQRLERLGWSRDDAVKIFGLCSNATERQRRTEEMKRLRQEEAEREKAARNRQAAENKLKSEQAAKDREQDRLVKLARQRERVLVDSGAAWAKRFGEDLSESIATAKRIYKSIAQTTTIPRDDIIKAVSVASRAKTVESVDQWTTEAVAIAQGAERPETIPEN